MARAPMHGCLAWLLAGGFAVGCEVGPPARGTYRLPFVDDTEVRVTNDYWNHNGEFDMGRVGSARGSLAATAPGWVRFIVDTHQEPTSSNNYVWIEHPYPYCQPAGVEWPGKPRDYEDWCIRCELEFCNEWTKYSHPATGTVTATGPVLVDGDYYLGAGLNEGEWVESGRYLGVEGDVGQASGVHVHWEVVILDPNDPITAGGFSKDWTGGAWIYSPNLFPTLCDGPFSTTEPFVLHRGLEYLAAPCG